MREAERAFGPVDVLVNDAGVIRRGSLSEMRVEDYREAMDTHFWGALVPMLEALPSMRRRRWGRIVNVTPAAGRVGFPHLVPYSASRSALVGLSEGLRAELRKDGVLVTTVTPDPMRAGGRRRARSKGGYREEHAWFKAADSLPPLSIDAERAARAARLIVAALRRGDANLTLTLPSAIATRLHGVFRGTTADVLSLVARSLAPSGGVGASHR